MIPGDMKIFKDNNNNNRGNNGIGEYEKKERGEGEESICLY